MTKNNLMRYGVPMTALAAAVSMLVACNSSDSKPTPTTSGVVMGAAIKNPTGFAVSAANATTPPGAAAPLGSVNYTTSSTGDSVISVPKSVVYANAKVCVDVNNNAVCDSGEANTTTAADGTFSIQSNQTGPLLAIVDTTATFTDPNTAALAHVAQKMLLRAGTDQIMAAGAAGTPIVISPLSTEILRNIEADSLTYTAATTALAARLSLNNTPALATDVTVTPAQVTSNLSLLSNTNNAQTALLQEATALTPRFGLASKMLDRGYISTPTGTTGADPITTLQQAQAGAFAPEGIPRYDNLFVVIFENHSNQTMDATTNPNFYKYLNVQGNKAANYFSTGNPSEPNYVALAAADDFGVADDNYWNCLPAGDVTNTATDSYIPVPACTNTTVHNMKGYRNLFSSLYQVGLPTRVYSESMDPGQDPRRDEAGNPNIIGTNLATGASDPMIGALYRLKHHPAVNFDAVRNRPDFFRNLTRTMGGGEWDSAIATYATANNIPWNTHQLEDDLNSGDVGALNYLIPDQCDDIHGNGTVVANCNNGATGIARGDAYVGYVVEKIKASTLWKNTNKKVGIVLVFDEGSNFYGSSSCCGWNVGGGATSGAPKDEGIATAIPNYNKGNKGDGPTIFGVLNNQAAAPKKIVDNDSYSHFSFVRTLQNMFGIADPGVATSYMNRSKYTQAYILQNLSSLAEYSGSANPHFDAVRPMNHKYVIQAGDIQSGGTTAGSSGSGTLAGGNNTATGPDANQTNIWALK